MKETIQTSQPFELKKLTKIDEFLLKFTRITFTEKIFFVDHIRTMVKAGLSLVDALSIMEKEMENKKFQRITHEIKERIEKGQPLSETLALYPKVFPSMYVKMIAAGETSGKLEEALSQTVIQMKKTNELISSIRGAMIYPSVIMFAMGGVGVLMTTVVLPKLLLIFKDFDAELPLPTKILIWFVDFSSNPITIILSSICTIGGIVLFVYAMRHKPSFKTAVHTLLLRLPIFGAVIKKINLAKFSLTLSSLLQSAIPIIDALIITGDTCGNVLFRDAIKSAAEEIKDGAPLSEVLRKNPHLFPPMVTEMIMVGERSGEVESLLRELALFYGDEVDKTMKNFSTIIEPVIILILGAAVAGIAVAVMMPMYSLVQNF